MPNFVNKSIEEKIIEIADNDFRICLKKLVFENF